MNSNSEVNPGGVLLPRDAASYIGLAPSTLAKLRCWGGGPEYLKLGRKIVYERGPLDAWREKRRVMNTSDAARVPHRLTESRGAA
jgi:hypothetical protein